MTVIQPSQHCKHISLLLYCITRNLTTRQYILKTKRLWTAALELSKGSLIRRLWSNLCAAFKNVCPAGESLRNEDVRLRKVLSWELPICPGSYTRL